MTKKSSNSQNGGQRRNTYLILIGSGGEGLYMRTERCRLSENRSVVLQIAFGREEGDDENERHRNTRLNPKPDSVFLPEADTCP